METDFAGGDKKPLRLLSLDGGGIRGLSELIILDHIMYRVGALQGLQNTPRPAEYFDMICGTSTGGLIAIMLGRLRFTASEAIDAYVQFSKKVFSETKIWPLQDGIFKASNLESAIKSVLGNDRENEMMFSQENLGRNDLCKTFVCAAAALHINGPPRLFRTWPSDRGAGRDNCSIVDACRATTAAPRFFKRALIGPPGMQEEFIDAGLGCNNPTKQLLYEATIEFGIERHVGCIVNLGTGLPRTNKLSKPSVLERIIPRRHAHVLVGIATDCEEVAQELEKKFRPCPGLFHRLNVDRGLEDVSLDEYRRLGEVKSHTLAYLRGMSPQLEVIAEALAGRPKQRVPLGHLDNSLMLSNRESANKFIIYPQHRVRYFVQRRIPLGKVEAYFRQIKHDGVTTPVIVLRGMGGSGKTQLALECCRRAEISGQYIAILWIHGANKATVDESFRSIARHVLGDSMATVDTLTMVQMVLHTIKAWAMPWFFIWDNYDNPAVYNIREYLPSGKSGTMMLTSRLAATSRLGEECIQIGDLLEVEALELFFRKSPSHLSAFELEHGSKIVHLLGLLALAIDQARAYIDYRGLRLDLFQEVYEGNRKAIQKYIPGIWEYTKLEEKISIFTTCELSYSQIAGNVESKQKLLLIAAFIGGSSISEQLFVNYFEAEHPTWMKSFSSTEDDSVWDSDLFGHAVADLENLSLLQNHGMWKVGASVVTKFSLHPVIRQWLQIRLPKEERQEGALLAAQVLRYSIHGFAGEFGEDERKSYFDSRHLRPHIESCYQYCEEHATQKLGVGDSAAAALRMARFYWYEGRYDRAEILQRRVVSSYSSNSSDIHILALRHLAATLRRRGVYEEAFPLQKKALDLKLDSSAEKNSEASAMLMSELAAIYRDNKEMDRAIDLQKEAVQTLELLRDDEDIEYLHAVGMLATMYWQTDRIDKSLPLQERVLNIRKQKLGDMHSATLNAKLNLAGNFYKLGQYDVAEKMELEVRNAREQIFGDQHPETIEAEANLASTWRAQNRLIEAKKLETRVLERKISLYGKVPSTIRSARALCSTLLLLGEREEAQRLQTEYGFDVLVRK